MTDMRWAAHMVRIWLAVLAIGAAGSAAAQSPVLFNKSFSPPTIVPGGNALMTLTIENLLSDPIGDIAFTDSFPAEMTLAAPASTDCLDGTLATTSTSIALSGGKLGVGQSCTVNAFVTATTAGTNTTGALTYTQGGSPGNAGTASATLTVNVEDAPLFSKAFSPDSIGFGETSTLTFTIDNTGGGAIADLDFTDTLPSGIAVASLPNASTSCGDPLVPPTLTAVAGGNQIVLDANGTLAFPAVAAGATCTVSVDVTGTAIGTHTNSATLLADFVDAGTAVDTLQVFGAGTLLMTKAFPDGVAAPGETTTLEITMQNQSRSETATEIAFTDNLAAMLAGTTYDALLFNDCGGTVGGQGTTAINFSGGTLAPGSSCTIRTTIGISVDTQPGGYDNFITNVTLTLGDLQTEASGASARLFVGAGTPLGFTKSFDPGSVGAGDTVNIDFRIENSNASGATAIGFTDNLSQFLGGLTVTGLPTTPCGAGSTVSTSVVVDDVILTLADGQLDANTFCEFSVEVTVPAGAAGGVYTNTTSALTATVNRGTVTSPPARDSLTVSGGADLVFTKEFTDDPVLAGSTGTLEFTITSAAESTADATAIAFTDDLPKVPGDMEFTAVGSDTCGGTADISTPTLLSYSGGSVAPGASCTIAMTFSVPSDATAGPHSNTTSALDFTAAGVDSSAPAATDALSVTPLDGGPLLLAKAFIDDPVIAGDEVTLRFTVTNPNQTTAGTIISFTDRLADVLPGELEATGPATFDDCGGTLTGATFLSYSDGSVAAQSSCTIEVSVLVPPGTPDGSYRNLTSELISSGGTSAPAAAILEVNSSVLQLTKSFAASTAIPGASVDLTFTLENTGASETVTNIAFQDDITKMIAGASFTSVPTGACGGTVVDTSGTLQLTGGALAAGEACQFTVTMQVPANAPAAVYTNTTLPVSGSIGDLSVSGPPATDDLQIVSAGPLGFSKAFAPDAVSRGQITRLTFTIQNADGALAEAIAFSDPLPTGLVLASPVNASNDCGGALTAGAGGSTIDFAGGSLLSGRTCTIGVDVDSAGAAPNSYNNVTGDLTSSFGNSGAASARLTITAPPVPRFSKAFGPNRVVEGAVSRLTFTIDNSGAFVEASALSFTDTLPVGVEVASPANVANGCTGGTVTASPGSEVITYTGGSVAAQTSCTIAVDVVPVEDGTFVNFSEPLSSSLGTSGAATATLTATPAPAPTLAKLFVPDSIPQGGTATVEFTIDNGAALVAAADLAFSDDLPTGQVIADPAGAATTCGGSVTAAPGGASMSFSGGSVAGGASCTVAFDVTAAAAGVYPNTSSTLGSSLGTGEPASDELTVTSAPAPLFSKLFVPDSIAQGATSTLTFTVDNDLAQVSADELAFTDVLPAGMTVAPIPNLSNSCGGALRAEAGSDTVELRGGSALAGEGCTISVDVVATQAGSLPNVSGDLTSTLGNSGSASDTLTVTAAPVPDFAKLFTPDSIAQGETSTLTLTIDNAAALVPATGLAVTDPFPAGLEIAAAPGLTSDCGGTLSAPAGGTSLTLSGGSLAAGASCTISVSVLATGSGNLGNTTGDLTSSLGNSGPASDTLNVDAAPVPGFAKLFAPDEVAVGGSTTLSFTIDNTASLVAAGDLAFTDPFPAGLAVAAAPNASSDCGGSFTADAGAASVALSGGSVAAGASCTISVEVTATETGPLGNVTGDLTSALGNSGPAADVLNVAAAPVPDFAKVFAPDSIAVGGTSTLSFTIDNAGALVAAEDLAFTDDFPAGLAVAAAPNVTNDCGGSFTASAGTTGVALAGGSVAAGSACTISVDVEATATGSLPNETGELTSSLGNSGTASATLAVGAAPAPGFAKSFSPESIVQGAVSTLTFEIDNGDALVEVTDLAFSDPLPDDVVIATLPNASDDCGGTLTVPAGGDTISYTGGALAAGASCTISVDVTSDVVGAHPNSTGDLTSSLGNSGTASATLTVTAAPAPGFAKAFSPETIQQDGVSTMIFTIDNSDALVPATGLSFTDSLPAAITLAAVPNPSGTCTGGSFVAAAGGSSFGYSGGSVAAGASCELRVDVTSIVIGTHPNTAGPLTSSLGNSGTASATLRVRANPNGTITIVQESDPDATFGFSSAEPALNFSITTAGGTGREGPITLTGGRYVVTQTRPEGFGNLSVTCSDNNSTADPLTGEVTINLSGREAVTCTFRSLKTDQQTIDAINRFLARRADFMLTNQPDPNRRFDRLNRGFGNSQPLSFASGDLMAMLPFSFDPMTVGRGDYTVSTSLLQMRNAAASLALAHGDPKGVRYVENYRWDLWLEAQYHDIDEGATSQGHFAIGYLGADYLVNENLLVGGLVQIDDMEDRSAAAGSTVSGTGWMVGPYMTARLSPNLYFDARIAAGQSENDISPFNTYTDSFSTDRWLAMASLTGQFERGPWTIRPAASLGYFGETQAGYVDSLGVAIPSQTVELGQLKIGPSFTGHFEGADGWLYQPTFGFDAIYNFGGTSGVTLTNPDSIHTEGLRGRMEAGLTMVSDGGARFSFRGVYDGIGASDFESWGLEFGVEIPFYKGRAR